MISILIPSRDEPKIHEMIKETEKLFPQDSQIIICNDRDGRGKGWAIRQALEAAQGDVICFIDGDLDIHPKMILRLLPFLDEYDVVLGQKQVRKLWTRRIMTRLSRLYLHLAFGFDYDTQTGIKLFKRYALTKWNTDSYMFDLEILANAHNAGMAIINVPVEITEYGSGSKPMRVTSVIKCFKDSLKIWWDFQKRKF